MQERQAEPDKFHRELQRLLEQLAAERRLVESQARQWPPILQGEAAEARFVLAAQQRVKRSATR
jgi:hypothetical protein